MLDRKGWSRRRRSKNYGAAQLPPLAEISGRTSPTPQSSHERKVEVVTDQDAAHLQEEDHRFADVVAMHSHQAHGGALEQVGAILGSKEVPVEDHVGLLDLQPRQVARIDDLQFDARG